MGRRLVIPCPGCGAYLRQHGWTADTVPAGKRLMGRHLRTHNKPCPERKGSTTHAEHLARGLEPLHCYVSAPIAQRAKAEAQTSSLATVLTEALLARWIGTTHESDLHAALSSALWAHLGSSPASSAEEARLVRVAVEELLALPLDALVRRLLDVAVDDLLRQPTDVLAAKIGGKT